MTQINTKFRSIVCTASLSILGLTSLIAEPLFPNSVVSNDLDFIKTDDPSEDFKLIKRRSSRQEMPSNSVGGLFMEDVHVFLVRYKDKAQVTIMVEPTLDKKQATDYATKVATALAKQPTALRKKLNRIIINKGDKTARAEETQHFFIMFSENIDKRISTHDLEETVFHETIHATLELTYKNHPDWLKAQRADPGFITNYAQKEPRQEDLPESALFAYTLIKHPGRLPQEIEKSIHEIMPNRLAFFKNLFENLDEMVDLAPDRKN